MKSFDHLDSLNFVDEHNQKINVFAIERIEQLQAREFVPTNATVLELGARYGSVSCSIAYKLDDDRRLFVVEPDSNVISALEANKRTTGCNFHIFNGIVSKKNMKLQKDNINGYGNFTTDIHYNETDTPLLKRKTLDDIEQEYNLKFDCLVADCEGFLEQFCDENANRLKDFNVIVFEADAGDRCNYSRVYEYLQQWGFRCIINGFHSVYVK